MTAALTRFAVCPLLSLVAAGSVGCPAPDGTSPTGTGGTWAEAASMDIARQETAVVALNREAIVIGGIVDDLSIVPTVEAYDPASDQWRELAPLPRALHHANAAVVDDTLVVAGGLTGLNFAGNQQVMRYVADTDTWSAGAAMPPGTERGGAAVAAWEGAIYVAGGYAQGRPRTEFSRYLVDEDRWETLPSLPSPRDHILAFADDGEIFVVGGREGAISSHVPSVLAFSIASEQWRETTPMPTSRAGAAGALAPDGRFVVVGGEGYTAEPSGVFPHTEAFSVDTERWDLLEPMRTPRHGMGAVFVGDTLVVPGGAEVEGFGASPVNEVFTLPPQ